MKAYFWVKTGFTHSCERRALGARDAQSRRLALAKATPLPAGAIKASKAHALP